MDKPKQTWRDFPQQIRYMVGNEACERFSFYGMRSILTIYMVQYLLMNEADSKAAYHLFVSACYLFPLLGGFISDRFFGKYKTILYLSLLYSFGNFAVALWPGRAGLFLGLSLIALGAGGIKPCVSAYIGDQFTAEKKHLVQAVYNIFYWSINFGSFFATMLIPWVLPRFGPGWAFGVPGILMILATLVFWAARGMYTNVPPQSKLGKAGFMEIFLYSLKHWRRRHEGRDFMWVAREKYPKEDVEAAEAAWGVFKLFITVSAFWALFDQHGSSWILQAQQMDLNFMGIEFRASQIAALNPAMVMVLIPVYAYLLYPAVERLGIKVTPLRRMSAGMVLAALSFVAVGMIQTALDSGQRVNVGWQFIPYLLLTMSEVMISVTGLEFAYTQAPKSMKSTIMSFWLLTVFVGNMLTAYVSKVNVFQGASFFFFFAALMAVVTGFFILGAARYRVREFLVSESDAERK
jgi:proton-dependent oligopeptide transporter, POT family